MNRKALDEYASFTEQKTELKRRQEENARGEAKIKQLIQTLDLRKDEAIERTFKVPCHLRPSPLSRAASQLALHCALKHGRTSEYRVQICRLCLHSSELLQGT